MTTRIIITGKANTISAQLAAIRRLGLVPAVNRLDSRAAVEGDADGFAVENTPQFVRINGRLFPFTGLAGASAAFCMARDQSGSISQNDRLSDPAPIAPDCEIIDANGNCLAFISYNGKCWAGPLDNQDYRCLFNPYADEESA